MGRRLLKFQPVDEIKPKSCKEGEISLEDFIELHKRFYQQKTLERLRERTLRDYELHFKYLKKYLEEEHRSMSNRSLDIDVIRSYVYYMQEEKQMSPFTINIRLRTLKCYLKWLFEEGYIKTPIYNKVKLQKTEEDTIKPLSDTDIRKMLKAPDRSTFAGFRDYVLMITMLDCGIRTNEALGIENNDIDLKRGSVNIWGNIAKTGHYRQVPLSNKTCKLIYTLIKNNNQNSSYVFQSSYDGKRMNTNAIVHSFEKYAKKVGVTARATAHTWRHSFAVNYLRNGGDIFILQKILGHTTMSTVRKYIQLSGQDVKEQHSKVNLIDNYI